MNRQECISALQKTAKADGFITMKEICVFTGISKPIHARKYVKGLDRFSGKYYFIPEVADMIMSQREQGTL